MRTCPVWLCLAAAVCGAAGAVSAGAQALSRPPLPLYETATAGTFTVAPVGGRTFRAGRPITLLLRVTNTYRTPLWLYHGDTDRTDYVYRVRRRDKAGALRDVPMTPLGRDTFAPAPRARFGLSTRGIGLAPGAGRSDRVLVSGLFDMRRPGDYVIQAIRKAVRVTGPGSYALAAPPLQVTVLPAVPQRSRRVLRPSL